MAKINLLPWRAERRERRKREFLAHLGIAAVAAIVLVAVWGLWMNYRIGTQEGRNAYLKGQIAQLDSKITEIKDYQKQKDQLLARKKIVEKLQSSRSQMVHLFDQIVKTIPAGARLTALKQKADDLTLDGVAQSNATVAEYMRNIEASPWMGPATLKWTRNVHSDTNTPYQFELEVKLGTPKAGADGEAPASAASVGTVAAAASAGAPASSLEVASAEHAAADAPPRINPPVIAPASASLPNALPGTAASAAAAPAGSAPATAASTQTGEARS